MAFVIAFAGKGGVGKTSLASLTVHHLAASGKGPVLAVDADPNACLNEALGVSVQATVGSMREASLDAVRSGAARPGGMSTEELIHYQIQQSLTEAPGFDLLVMGRPEGPGCYCAANNIIRKYTDRLADQYRYLVLDNEAGLEHLSRHTSRKVDLLIIVSDPTTKGIRTARRVFDMIDELKIHVQRAELIMNRAGSGDEKALSPFAETLGLHVAGSIPEDRAIAAADLQGKPVVEIAADSPARAAFEAVLDKLAIP
ncbi:MAG: CO dehydrogenase maturation factor [Nitrospirae bacterium]|nr:MAG: CO dehydrogenase maturation factor [Nitrospirota bacterium]